MNITSNLYDLFADKAQKAIVAHCCVGIGYTVVLTDSGGAGLSYTHFETKGACSLIDNFQDYEGRPASTLLEGLNSSNSVKKSMGLALVNALNHDQANQLPTDDGDLFKKMSIGNGTRVAMAGFFGPMMKRFNQEGAELEIYDLSKNMGCEDVFFEKIKNWAEVLILTSTSILNGTVEKVLNNTGPDVKTVMLGPSTPMAPKAFDSFPVHMLAGTVLIDNDNVLKSVRQGAGTPVISRFCRKVYSQL